MSIRSATLGVLLLAASVSTGFAEDQPTAQVAPQEPQWTEFQSAERGFAISFPGTPKTTSAPVEGQNPLLQHDFQVSVGEDIVYSVVVFEYPTGNGPSPDTDAYLKLVNAYAKGSESRLRNRGPATIAGRPGFEAIADDGKSKLSHLIDVVPAGDRIYMLVTVGPKRHATGEDAERFRDSFRLLGDGSDPQSAANPPAQ
ncbi:MAG: hypothetical protein H7X74_02410 [Methyloceanibacter sp.]|nr:hypothetical protein [Methyloceanibacter sp.]